MLLHPDTIDAVSLAEFGKGNDLLRKKYKIGLSDGQFTYRLKLAKELAGFKKGDGFRKAWREGRSRYEDILEVLLPKARENYEKTILSQIERATPKVSPPQPEPEPAKV